MDGEIFLIPKTLLHFLCPFQLDCMLHFDLGQVRYAMFRFLLCISNLPLWPFSVLRLGFTLLVFSYWPRLWWLELSVVEVLMCLCICARICLEGACSFE